MTDANKELKSVQKEYNINGRVYRLVEEEPVKREPIKAYANVFSNGDYVVHPNRNNPFDGEQVELHEVPEGHKVISREMIANAWDTEAFLELNHSEDSWIFIRICKSLGFGEKE